MRTYGEALRNSEGLDSLENYSGDDQYFDWYMVVGRSRDSDPLEESNFATALKQLGGESETVQVMRVGHWACGWIEEIMVHPSDTVAVAKAQEIKDSLEEYPVLDEQDFSEREYEAALETWENCFTQRQRIEFMRKHERDFHWRDLASMISDSRGRSYHGDTYRLS